MKFKKPFITRHQTSLGDRLTRRIAQRVMDEDGSFKNGYTLIMGLIIGYIAGGW